MAWDAIKTNGEVWDGKDFVFDLTNYTPGDAVVISDMITNNSEKGNMDIVVDLLEIETVDPASTFPDGTLSLLVQEETLPGKFATLVASDGRDLSKAKVAGWTEIKFVIQTASPADQGQPYDTTAGLKWYSSEAPSGIMRMALIYNAPDVASPNFIKRVKINGSYRLY